MATKPQAPDPITIAQLQLVSDIAERLRLSRPVLDDYIRGRFGTVSRDRLTKREGSMLLTTMMAWRAAPDDMKIAMGQRKLM